MIWTGKGFAPLSGRTSKNKPIIPDFDSEESAIEWLLEMNERLK